MKRINYPQAFIDACIARYPSDLMLKKALATGNPTVGYLIKGKPKDSLISAKVVVDLMDINRLTELRQRAECELESERLYDKFLELREKAEKAKPSPRSKGKH